MNNKLAKPHWAKLTDAQWNALSFDRQQNYIANHKDDPPPPPASAKAQALLARIHQQKEEIEAVQTYWIEVFPDYDKPDVLQCRTWLNRYGFDTVVRGIEGCLVKLNKCQKPKEGEKEREFGFEDAIKYASGTMKKIALESQQ